MLLNELKHTHKRPVDTDSEYGMEAGRYIGLHFDDETKNSVQRIVHDEAIPNSVRTDKLHTTITYSRENPVKDYSVNGEFDEPICAEIESFDIFPSQNGKNCLVAKLNCPECISKHEKTRELGASYDYDEYIPHLTLSYDVGDMSADKLEELTKKYKGTKLYANEEYDEPIDDEWTNNL